MAILVFLHPYLVVAADALREISMAIVTAVLSLNEHLSQTLSVSLNFVTSQCIVVLFFTSLIEYTLLNASRTAANDFNAK
jgi:ABC-type antimicrobial peptide transport system ATPase subunit